MSLFEAVIFDLDGVIVSTDNYHFLAWGRMCEEEGIKFNSEINHRLRGVSRMESLNIILENTEKQYSNLEKEQLAKRKNDYYRNSLSSLSDDDLLPGVRSVLDYLKNKGVRVAIGSSSKNTPMILKQVKLNNYFDAVSDGNDIVNSKPDPEVFLLAAKKLGIEPEKCLVIEDAMAGVEAAHRGRMKVAAIGDAANSSQADYILGELEDLKKVIN
ncbi:beta-phosphoglucomutase [Aquibacillus halophilus]|uniref:Beta-phosphoglucomutase n=1 Tax=Aquibacillus halophilus TaxID=930132 RepID=A0A6A8D924_9BACI|nr:beta-phosphoglucomutase [Aquibacillus halophilus]MRH42104.1 beta-phosphoglucomutase [Aquibacillus halophilus]